MYTLSTIFLLIYLSAIGTIIYKWIKYKSLGEAIPNENDGFWGDCQLFSLLITVVGGGITLFTTIIYLIIKYLP